MKGQKGFSLIGVLIIIGALLITAGGAVVLPAVKQAREQEVLSIPSSSPEQERFGQQKPLLKILPPKERTELESAIEKTQQVLENIKIFNFSLPTAEDIKKSLDQINRPAPKQIPTMPPVDTQKIEEYFQQNPPAVPQEGKEFSPEEQEYYYRKYILKDPAFQW